MGGQTDRWTDGRDEEEGGRPIKSSKAKARKVKMYVWAFVVPDNYYYRYYYYYYYIQSAPLSFSLLS